MKNACVLLFSLLLVSCQFQNKEEIEKAKQASIDSMKTAMEQQRVVDSMQAELTRVNEEKEAVQNSKTVVVNNTTTQAAPKRKGMSNAAKGALIGAGVGAATGAIVSKKKGTGAIIGGLAGAGVGAGTGAIIDEKKKE
ncbi:YMGG-like glycine zipper-containing protein [Flavobacterium terrigena]|uniref:Glycine zipper n=1 Tax=Flavobacterium terrigena TaxID=402734 RepID=A0A1H6WPV3_9FLAO|nr:YMGG-like glycine zipper-containing protein [Flavobacterium terrigena]SEJ17224.1 Glycine zipper [Flavobacterium terrigena]